MEKLEYRTKPDSIFHSIRWLQFKSKAKFMFWEFEVWRYVPDSIVANCFKETDCPFLWVPFSTSHCFVSGPDKYISEFVAENPNLDSVFEKFKSMKKRKNTIEYLKNE